MGTMTKTQLENELRYNLGGRTDLDSRLVTFLNWAQEEIASRHRFRELEQLDTTQSTTADQDYISHPSEIRDLISIRVLDGTRSRKLRYVPERKFDRLIAKPDEYTTDRPTHFYSWGDRFYLWRIPDDAYSVRIRYTKWPANLSAESDTSELEHLDEAIVALATAKALDSLEVGLERVLRWRKRADRLIDEAIKRDRSRFTDEEIQGYYNISDSDPDYWKDPFVRRVR